MWGPGLIAAISGIELTNIVLYMFFGAVYGFYSIIFISVMFLATIYIQQTITLLYVSLGKRLSSLIRSLSKDLFSLYRILIYISSNLILLVNILVLTYIYYLMFGGSWIPYIIVFITIMFSLANTYRFKSVEKVLGILSILLLTYLAALVYLVINNEASTIINLSSIGARYSHYALIAALWGSIASPYSLMIQEDARSTNDLLPAYIFGVLIGTSIAYYSYLSGINPSDIRMLIYLPLDPALSSKILLVGITATVILASISILLTSSAITMNTGKVLVSRYKFGLSFTLIFIASIVLLAPFLRTLPEIEKILVDITIYASDIVGLLFSLSILILSFVFYYLYRSSGDKLYKLNMLVLSAIAIISLIISFKALIDEIIALFPL
ncbi:hypothetical protein Shell_1157 [Staphylothermus hellenicus DSM 12710]|uniref:Uncharacterized protein n=2 Tax=Staphylothermus hellenicus TaxID=84599 RepID=D7D912_STAHD|nr:hypothetical protein Shell_1157 [Staphylothermus hellenicus DSM 12710]